MDQARREEIREKIRDCIRDSEFVLVGIGREWMPDEESVRQRTAAYDDLAGLLAGKPYFVLTECPDESIFFSKIPEFFLCAPFADEKREAASSRRWEEYLNWLSATMGKRLFLLELGVGFEQPELIRWPFEKCVQFNQKARLLRIHHSLALLPEGLEGRGEAVKENSCFLFEKQK